jgi:hypothetical protein
MADLLTTLTLRALGQAQTVQPMLRPMYAPQELTPAPGLPQVVEESTAFEPSGSPTAGKPEPLTGQSARPAIQSEAAEVEPGQTIPPSLVPHSREKRPAPLPPFFDEHEAGEAKTDFFEMTGDETRPAAPPKSLLSSLEQPRRQQEASVYPVPQPSAPRRMLVEPRLTSEDRGFVRAETPPGDMAPYEADRVMNRPPLVPLSIEEQGSAARRAIREVVENRQAEPEVSAQPAPASWPEAPSLSETPPPAVHITIGRIEVRASLPAEKPAPAHPAAPKLSLDEYLRQQGGGRR